MDTIDRLTDVFRTIFEDESIELSDAMTADQIEGWDSVAHVSLIFAVEEEFGVTFSTKELEQIQNVGDLRIIVQKRLGAGSG